MVPHHFLWFSVVQQIFGSLIISFLKIFLVDPIYLIDGQYIGYLILQFSMPDLLALQPYKIVITRFFFPVLYFKLLRNIYWTYDKIFGMCASINNKNCSCKPGKSFITQNHLLILWGKNTREKFVTQGKVRENTGNFISAGMWPPCQMITIFTSIFTVLLCFCITCVTKSRRMCFCLSDRIWYGYVVMLMEVTKTTTKLPGGLRSDEDPRTSRV